METADRILIMVEDMFFAAKIRGAAELAGRQVERIKSREQLERDAAADPPSLLLIDLNSNALDPIDMIRFIKSHPALGAVPMVGFLSHVQLDLKRAAAEAGCDYVIPRSLFSTNLPQIVSGDLASLE